MLKNKKILIILLLTIVLLTFSISNCFAAETRINSLNVRDYWAIAEDICSENGWHIYEYIVSSDAENGYIYVYPDSSIICNIEYSEKFKDYYINTDGARIICFEDANDPFAYFVFDTTGQYCDYDLANNIIYSSFDIYNSDGTLFFQKTPLSQGTLAPIMGEAKPMMKEITTTLVGLLKSLIPFLICLLAFWKGWHLLSKILHQA